MTPKTSTSPLRYREFRHFLLARFLATVAIQMQSVALGWQVYALTGNPLDLGLVGLAQFAPFVLLVLVAGQVADRIDRRRIITVCYAVEMLCGVLFMAFTLSGIASVWPIFLTLALYGSARAFMMPASQSVVIHLVPRGIFSKALALNSSVFQFATITGPALGGLIYLAGPEVVYGTVTTLLGLACMLMLSLPRAQAPAGPRRPLNITELTEGLRFVRSRPALLGAISLDLFAVLFGGATALLPAYANDVLHVGPIGLGLLRTAPGLGAAVTGLVLAAQPITRRAGARMFGGVAVYGIAVIVFGASKSFPLSLAMLFLMGAGDMVSVFVRHMLVQLETPDTIRGRVSAVNSVFIGASNELGEFESGVTAAWFGLVPAVMLGGLATLLVTLGWMAGFPALRRMDAFPSSGGTAAQARTPPQAPPASRHRTRARKRGR